MNCLSAARRLKCLGLARSAVASAMVLTCLVLAIASTAHGEADVLPSPLRVAAVQPRTMVPSMVALEFDPGVLEAMRGRQQVRLRDFPLAAQPGRAAEATLTLQAMNVFGPHTRLVAMGPNGEENLPLPDVMLFSGRIEDDPESRVFLSFSEGRVNGYIQTDAGVQVLSAGPADEPMQPVVYDLSALPPGIIHWRDHVCETVFQGPPPQGLPPAGLSGAQPCRKIVVAIETDYEFTQLLGSTGAATAYVATLIGAASEIYTDALNVNLQMGFTRIWPNASDPWNAGSMGAQLDQFVAHWQQNMTHIPRHLAHFLSGRNLGGGLAYLNVVCSNNGYAISTGLEGGFPYPLQHNSHQNWDIIVFAHELGHNFGALHTHSHCPPLDQCAANCNGSTSCINNATIMSYCHLCPGGLSNIRLEFHQGTLPNMISHLNSLSCETTCDPVPEVPLGYWTIIIHGWLPEGGSYASISQPGGWMRNLADRIADIAPTANVMVHRMNSHGSFALSPPGPFAANAHHVLLFNWSGTSGNISDLQSLVPNSGQDGYAYAAGEALYALLRWHNIHNRVHAIIGHSRGAVVASEAARRLILDGASPSQVIYVDADGDGLIVGGKPQYKDSVIKAWQSDATQFDYVLSSFQGELPGNLGEPAIQGARTRNVGAGYSHPGLAGPGQPPPIYDFLISDLTIGAAQRYSLPDSPGTPWIAQLGSRTPMTQPERPVNGAFNWKSLAAWKSHGGATKATLQGSTNKFLRVEKGKTARHSWFFIRSTDKFISFRFRVEKAEPVVCNDQLRLQIQRQGGQTSTINVTRTCNTTSKWISYTAEVPFSHRGHVNNIRFLINGGNNNVRSRVLIDDITLHTANPPGTPANVSATDGQCNRVRVTWLPGAGATSYSIWRSPNSNVNNATPVGVSNGMSFDDNSAAPGVSYYYWVKSVKGTRSSMFSNKNAGWRAACSSSPPPAGMPPAGSGQPMAQHAPGGSMNVRTLMLVLASWGPCLATPCEGDLNDDGVVDINDLLMVFDDSL